MKVEKGNKVKVEYEGKFEDGTVFDSSEKHGRPLEFEAGAGMVVPGFDAAVIGMEKDEEKEFKIEPKDAYGELNPEAFRKVPREQIPTDAEIKPGMMLGVQMPNGQQMPVKVSEVSDTEITLDLNHPLAGKTLNFKIKIVDIS